MNFLITRALFKHKWILEHYLLIIIIYYCISHIWWTDHLIPSKCITLSRKHSHSCTELQLNKRGTLWKGHISTLVNRRKILELYFQDVNKAWDLIYFQNMSYLICLCHNLKSKVQIITLWVCPVLRFNWTWSGNHRQSPAVNHCYQTQTQNISVVINQSAVRSGFTVDFSCLDILEKVSFAVLWQRRSNKHTRRGE